ncbi:MAG: DUF2853 family protein [Epsilonproteobacteria bacterium]|nr:DUF2853 family protein [Campylobacterota bacterium]
MSKLDEKIALYQEENKKLGLGMSDEYIANIAKSLGPAIYRADTEIVACGDKSELDRIRNNFLKKKLGLDKPNAELDEMLKRVCEKLGTANRRKYRALFYGLLAKEAGKEDIYLS